MGLQIAGVHGFICHTLSYVDSLQHVVKVQSVQHLFAGGTHSFQVVAVEDVMGVGCEVDGKCVADQLLGVGIVGDDVESSATRGIIDGSCGAEITCAVGAVRDVAMSNISFGKYTDFIVLLPLHGSLCGHRFRLDDP